MRSVDASNAETLDLEAEWDNSKHLTNGSTLPYALHTLTTDYEPAAGERPLIIQTCHPLTKNSAV